MEQENWYDILEKDDVKELSKLYNIVPSLINIIIHGVVYNTYDKKINVTIHFNQEVDNPPPKWKMIYRKFVNFELEFSDISEFELTKNINLDTSSIKIEIINSEILGVKSEGRMKFNFLSKSFKVKNVRYA